VAGTAVCDNGIVIDLSAMRAVRVDPANRRAWVQGGALWGDVDNETQTHGLATTGGIVSHTGVGGLTLGGGVGWLMRKHGLTVDNLLAADVVTADGELLRASEDEHADLFWALRGGGGNFGVVTSFEYRLHPVERLLAGLVAYPIEHGRAALELFREVTSTAPDELSCAFVMVTSPDGGPPVAAIAACYNGPIEDGERLVAPIRRLGPPLDDGIRPMAYPEVQRIFAEIPFGLQNYWKGHFLRDMPDEVIEATVDSFARVTSDHSAILIEAPHGAVGRVPDDATAFGQRQARFNASALAVWEGPADPDRHVRWVREYADAIAPYASGDYVNYLAGDASSDEIASAYGRERFQRLVALKDRYDPSNTFRFNSNIPPTPPG
jgi:FAD/FMN-containing dehydrogenase